MIRQSSKFFARCALASVLTLGAVSMPALAEAASIKAVVNGAAVTDYDIEQRSKMMRITGQPMGREAVLESLVQERLKIQEAERLGISVSDDEVETAFASVAQRTRMAPNQLVSALAQVGIDARTLKNRIRADLAWRNVVQRSAGRNARVTEQDMFAAVQADGDPTTELTEYDLVLVTIVGSGAGGRAGQIRSRFSGCETLDAVRGLNGVVVKPLGKRRSSELSETYANAVSGVDEGRISSAFQDSGNLNLLAVCGKRTVRDQDGAMREAQQELFSEKLDIASRRMVKDLMQDAIIEYR